jgi:hypothetical protein
VNGLIGSFDELVNIRVRQMFIFLHSITDDSDEPIDDSEIILTEFSNHIAINILFIKVFPYWFREKRDSLIYF